MSGEVRNIASSCVTYVALDENRKPTPVPPLAPADAEEAERIERARIRHIRMQQIEEELTKAKSS